MSHCAMCKITLCLNSTVCKKCVWKYLECWNSHKKIDGIIHCSYCYDYLYHTAITTLEMEENEIKAELELSVQK